LRLVKVKMFALETGRWTYAAGRVNDKAADRDVSAMLNEFKVGCSMTIRIIASRWVSA
jgi:hypothetical protein